MLETWFWKPERIGGEFGDLANGSCRWASGPEGFEGRRRGLEVEPTGLEEWRLGVDRSASQNQETVL